MNSGVSPLVWGITIASLIAVIALDLFVVSRRKRAATVRGSALWVCIYVALAVLFASVLFTTMPAPTGSEFVAGYLTEYSLSVDNLFVFLLIMKKFAVPSIAQDKALYIGIVLSLVLRTIFIVVGAAAVQRINAILFILGAFLLYTAVRLVLDGGNETEEYRENAVVKLFRQIVPISREYAGARFTTNERSGRHRPSLQLLANRRFTPLVIVVAAIAVANVVFALDSMPAIFGLTKNAYVIFTANALALMGLRQLYFLIGGLLDKVIYLNYGLAAILAFIGVKLVIEALRTAGVHSIGPLPLGDIGIIPSLAAIVLTLTLTVGVSLIVSSRRARASGETDGQLGRPAADA